MSSRMTIHERYESWSISLPFSEKQQREMTKFCVAQRIPTTDNFQNVHFEICAAFHIQFPDKFEKEKETKSLYSIATFVGKI